MTGVRWTFGSLRVGTVLGREPNGDRPAPLALAGASFRARPLHRSRRWGSGDHWPYKNAVVRVNFSGRPGRSSRTLWSRRLRVSTHDRR